jgi:hypothetical protein
VGPPLAPPPPAAIPPAPMGAAGRRGLDGARPAGRRGQRLGGRWRRRGGLGGGSRTQGARRSRGQAHTRWGFLGALAAGWLGGHARLVRGSGLVGPHPAEPEEDAHQRHEPEGGEKESWYQGHAPAEDGVRGTLSRVWGLSE